MHFYLGNEANLHFKGQDHIILSGIGMSLKKQASMRGQHHRNRWSRWIRIGGQDGSEYTLIEFPAIQ